MQGVGFRPFVYGLAHHHQMVGFVGNDNQGVFIEAEGSETNIAAFQHDLVTHTPPLALIENVISKSIPPCGDATFTIVESRSESSASALVSPDLCICDDCLEEVFDPNCRFFRYPFINCTNCGPRFTIIRDLPYDRPFTTMVDFPLCEACAVDYHDPLNRRFHAQPIACPHCGPRLEYIENGQHLFGEAALQLARQSLLAGKIIAVKGLGGFHIACDATNEDVVQSLRQRKGRSDKPFAVTVYDLEIGREFAVIDSNAAQHLANRTRPIMLLPKYADSRLAPSVAPKILNVGVMLPYTPLHYLLLHDLGIPLVMTSGNYSSEPIITDNAEALKRLAPLVDGFLLHNRDIHISCDDSVVQLMGDTEIPLRRSRGYAPFPVKLPVSTPHILAVGGELKNTFCVTRDSYAFISQHIGDMENLETLNTFESTTDHMQKLFGVQPEMVACDMHPTYLSTRWATQYAEHRNVPLVKVQHHHAHVAALMVEHGLDGQQPIIGISFDGTGYGTDGAIWGGEIMIADYVSYERPFHLAYMPLAGGDTSINKPYRIALAYLHAVGIEWDEDLPPVAFCPELERRVLRQQLEREINTVATSSMGRLFDAVSSLIGVRHIISYEAQAAMEFEALVTGDATFYYDYHIAENCVDLSMLLKQIVEDLYSGVSASEIARRFHQTIAYIALECALRIRQSHHVNTVGLTGGVFQNITLLGMTHSLLAQSGFNVLVHQKVPANDGGIALGQAMIAHYRTNL